MNREERERERENSPTAQQPPPPPKIQQHHQCQIHTHKPKQTGLRQLMTHQNPNPHNPQPTHHFPQPNHRLHNPVTESHNPAIDSHNPVIDFHNLTIDSSIPQPSNHHDPHLKLEHKRRCPPQTLISTNPHPPPR